MKTSWLAMVLFIAMLATSAFADINDLVITELWVGRPGPDGTRDWVEVTNTGDTPVQMSDVAYDDVSADISVASVFPNEILMPGESLVLLIDIDADNTTFANAGAEFLAVWDPFDALLIGTQADGGLGGGGDSANLLEVATGGVLDTFTYAEDELGDRTLERIGEGSTDIRLSELGENGAFEAQEFTDEMGTVIVGDDGEPVILIGSPGIFKGFGKGVLVGDVNCDGSVDLLDVGPFVDAVTSGEFNTKADINSDGAVDLLDVSPFVDLLTG